MGSHGLMGKDVWYDESLLVPFLIRWPDKIAPGREDLLFSTPDIMPTLLGLKGLDERVPAGVEGSDYAGIFLGQSDERPTSAFYFLAVPQFPSRPERRGIRTDRYTFVVIRQAQRDEFVLHDNLNDPYQCQNIAEQRPDLVRSLIRELNDWLIKTNDSWQPVR